MSSFHELTDIKATNQNNAKEDAIDVDVPIDDTKDFDDLNEVRPDERWSWNPYDWYLGIVKELKEFNLDMTERRRVLIRAIIGEGLVTFLFLFTVEAVAVNNGRQPTPENLALGAIATAFCAIAYIYSFADVSGAHFNPAVTFATMVTGKVSVRKGLAFIGVQLFASIIATLFLMAVFPGVQEGGALNIPKFLVVDVDPSATLVNAFLMELILTFILVYVIFATAFDTVDTKGVKVKEAAGQNLTIYTTSGTTKAGFAPIAIGFTLGFLGLLGGSVSGGAFNPARAFGPALLSGSGWGNHWIYWIGDLMGAALAGSVQHFFAHEAQQSSAAIKTRAQAKLDDAGYEESVKHA